MFTNDPINYWLGATKERGVTLKITIGCTQATPPKRGPGLKGRSHKWAGSGALLLLLVFDVNGGEGVVEKRGVASPLFPSTREKKDQGEYDIMGGVHWYL